MTVIKEYRYSIGLILTKVDCSGAQGFPEDNYLCRPLMHLRDMPSFSSHFRSYRKDVHRYRYGIAPGQLASEPTQSLAPHCHISLAVEQARGKQICFPLEGDHDPFISYLMIDFQT